MEVSQSLSGRVSWWRLATTKPSWKVVGRCLPCSWVNMVLWWTWKNPRRCLKDGLHMFLVFIIVLSIFKFPFSSFHFPLKYIMTSIYSWNNLLFWIPQSDDSLLTPSKAIINQLHVAKKAVLFNAFVKLHLTIKIWHAKNHHGIIDSVQKLQLDQYVEFAYTFFFAKS